MTLRNNTLDQRVDELMLEADHASAPELRSALISLGSLALLPAPAPGPALAALIAGQPEAGQPDAGQPDAGQPDDLTRRRWLHRHRPSVVGIAVLTGMGLGVSGVAASDPEPYLFDSRVSIQQMTQDWIPAWSVPVAASAQAQGVSGEVLSAPLIGPAAVPRMPAQAHAPELNAPGLSPNNSERHGKTSNPEQRSPEQRSPEQRSPEQRSPEQRSPEQSSPEQRSGAGKDVVGAAGPVSKGKEAKLDAGAAGASAVEVAAAEAETTAAAIEVEAAAAASATLAARTPETETQVLALVQGSAESVNVAPPAPELRLEVGRWTGAKVDKESAARQANGSASGWHKKFKR